MLIDTLDTLTIETVTEPVIPDARSQDAANATLMVSVPLGVPAAVEKTPLTTLPDETVKRVRASADISCELPSGKNAVTTSDDAVGMPSCVAASPGTVRVAGEAVTVMLVTLVRLVKR